MTLTLMCGLSFSGKSTLAARLAEGLPASVISLDLINEERGLYGGQGIPWEEWAKTNQIAHERGQALLEAGHHVVVDDTGSPRFIRDGWRAVAERSNAPFALVWVQIGADLQSERIRVNRRSHDRHDVTDSVLQEHRASFEPPTDEDALVIDAESTADPEQVAALAHELSSLRVP
ncbi:AAA family ATPase [Brachybacterium fresconis]|uniref:Kinase n=1 Tax=Brachybacterium fresconis TaxID=173363 RepID=A0ABS4YHQ5_9MICO|nr:ATP-binding protein [Brachybacterium fresconis]MBP2407413.1 putative kinase [Brachybacterium fresconis]